MRIKLAQFKGNCLLLIKGWIPYHPTVMLRVTGFASGSEHRFPRRELVLCHWGHAFDPVKCILSL